MTGRNRRQRRTGGHLVIAMGATLMLSACGQRDASPAPDGATGTVMPAERATAPTPDASPIVPSSPSSAESAAAGAAAHRNAAEAADASAAAQSARGRGTAATPSKW